MALFSYDINEDGVKELIVGWANGRVGGCTPVAPQSWTIE